MTYNNCDINRFLTNCAISLTALCRQCRGKHTEEVETRGKTDSTIDLKEVSATFVACK